MGRHNRKVHGNGEYADIHLSNNPEPKEEQIITLDEDFKEPPQDEEASSFADETEESCQIQVCGEDKMEPQHGAKETHDKCA